MRPVPARQNCNPASEHECDTLRLLRICLDDNAVYQFCSQSVRQLSGIKEIDGAELRFGLLRLQAYGPFIQHLPVADLLSDSANPYLSHIVDELMDTFSLHSFGFERFRLFAIACYKPECIDFRPLPRSEPQFRRLGNLLLQYLCA